MFPFKTQHELSLFFNYHELRDLCLSFRLWISTKDGNQENLGGTTLDRYVYMEQNNHVLTCKIKFPVKGTFKFELFGRKSLPDENMESQTLGVSVGAVNFFVPIY